MRVGVGLIKDNIGSYDTDMFVTLSEIHQSDRPISTRHIPADDITRLVTVKNGAMGQGMKRIEYFKIGLICSLNPYKSRSTSPMKLFQL